MLKARAELLYCATYIHTYIGYILWDLHDSKSARQFQFRRLFKSRLRNVLLNEEFGCVLSLIHTYIHIFMYVCMYVCM